MKILQIFLLPILLLISFDSTFGLTCNASWESNCTNASYCTSIWESSSFGRAWTLQTSTQSCTKTQSVMLYANQWFYSARDLMDTITAKMICNDGDNCNNIPPPYIFPARIYCTMDGNSQCYSGTACVVERIESYLNSETHQYCDPGHGEIFANQQVNGDTICIKTSHTALNAYNAVYIKTTHKCYCWSKTRCNYESLLSWGEQHYQTTSVTCNLGSGITTSAQYCRITADISNANTSRDAVYEAVTSTEANVFYGCEIKYGEKPGAVLLSCTCNTDNCNVIPPSTTMPPETTGTNPISTHTATVSISTYAQSGSASTASGRSLTTKSSSEVPETGSTSGSKPPDSGSTATSVSNPTEAGTGSIISSASIIPETGSSTTTTGSRPPRTGTGSTATSHSGPPQMGTGSVGTSGSGPPEMGTGSTAASGSPQETGSTTIHSSITPLGTGSTNASNTSSTTPKQNVPTTNGAHIHAGTMLAVINLTWLLLQC